MNRINNSSLLGRKGLVAAPNLSLASQLTKHSDLPLEEKVASALIKKDKWMVTCHICSSTLPTKHGLKTHLAKCNKEDEGYKDLPSPHNPCLQLLSSDFPSTTLPTMKSSYITLTLNDQPVSTSTRGSNF